MADSVFTNKRTLGIAQAVGSAALWPLGAIFAVLSFRADISISVVLCTRVVVSGVLLFGFLIVRRRPLLRPPPRTLPLLVVYGLDMAAINLTYYLSIERIPVGVTLSLQFTAPIMVLSWMTLIRRIVYRSQVWIAVLVSLFGVVLVSNALGGLRSKDINVAGVSSALMSAVCLASLFIHTEALGRKQVPSMTTMFWGFAVATTIWMVFAPVWTWPIAEFVSSRVGLWIVGVAVVGTLVPFVFNAAAARTLPASTVAIIATSEPAFGAIFGWMFLSQHLGATQWVGGVLIMGGVVAAEMLTRSPTVSVGHSTNAT